jgi:hypothetical protein
MRLPFFFITRRPEKQEHLTIDCHREAGYKGWADLERATYISLQTTHRFKSIKTAKLRIRTLSLLAFSCQ